MGLGDASGATSESADAVESDALGLPAELGDAVAGAEGFGSVGAAQARLHAPHPNARASRECMADSVPGSANRPNRFRALTGFYGAAATSARSRHKKRNKRVDFGSTIDSVNNYSGVRGNAASWVRNGRFFRSYNHCTLN